MYQRGINKFMLNGIKNIILLLLLISSAQMAFGQGPSLSPHDLKESYLEKRAAFKHHGTKMYTADEQAQLTRIVEILKENAPNSFEYHLVQYLHGRHDFSLVSHLMEAKRLQPDNPELVVALFAYYYLSGKEKEAKILARRMIRALGESTIEYYQEVTADPTIDLLILSGEKDAYPVMALQLVGKLRADIRLVNLDFLLNSNYRKDLNADYGMGNTTFLKNEQNYISRLVKKAGWGVAISTTVHQAYLSGLGNNLFLTGLTYRYKVSNQFNLLNQFWGRAQADLANRSFESRAERKLYRNYLPALLTCYQLHEKGGATRKAIKKTLVDLTGKIGKKEEVLGIIKAYDETE